MKNKVVTSLIFIIFAYFLPLTWQLNLFFSANIFILIIIAVVLFATQPPLSLVETRETSQNDRYSILVILIGCVACQVFSVLEWAIFRSRFHAFHFDLYSVIGLLLLGGGTLFRIWSIMTLGKFFTATVQTQSHQTIIDAGPYRLIRHPSYLGAYLAISGSAILLHAKAGILFSVIVMLAAYDFRITVEEKALIKAFGKQYVEYRSRTYRLIPFIY